MVILDRSIGPEVFSSRLLHLSPDGISGSERIWVLSVSKLCLGTFTRGTVISATHGCCCYLCTVHAQQVPKSAALAHELVCKPIVVVLGADVIDFRDDVSHCWVVQAHAALNLPQSLLVLVQAEPLRIGRHARTRQAYGLDITVLSLFKHPTAKEMICQFIWYITY